MLNSNSNYINTALAIWQQFICTIVNEHLRSYFKYNNEVVKAVHHCQIYHGYVRHDSLPLIFSASFVCIGSRPIIATIPLL